MRKHGVQLYSSVGENLEDTLKDSELMTTIEIMFVLKVSAIAGAIGGGVSWLLQKMIEQIFAKRLEDHRHKNALAAQDETIRLDLYNRRFEIFSSIFNFHEALVSWKGTPEQIAARARFFRAYQEAGFLFQKGSGIEELFNELNQGGAKVIGFKEHSDDFKADPAVYMAQRQETNRIMTTVFTEALGKLKVAISPYLDFHNIER